MSSRPAQAVLALAVSLLTLASGASAATFDVIWADHLTVTTYPSNTGFTLSGDDIALVVNKGPTDINGPEFFGAALTGTSSNQAVAVFPFINNPGPPITPIHPNEAIGSVTFGNNVLTGKLLPGETFHNTGPLQVIALQVNYPPHYSGSAVFDLTMTMGGNIAHYAIQVSFVAGSNFSIAFDTAARTSAVPLPTPARLTSWGQLKKLYR